MADTFAKWDVIAYSGPKKVAAVVVKADDPDAAQEIAEGLIWDDGVDFDSTMVERVFAPDNYLYFNKVRRR